MKIAIIYASKTGTTKKCAEDLSKQLNGANVIDIETKDVDLAKYDIIIIGSNIRIGQINKKIKKLIKENIEILKSKRVAYYICCGFPDESKSCFENNFPKELLDAAIIYSNFGGEMEISKQKGIDKFIVKMISKTEAGKKEIKLIEENIKKFSEEIKKYKL